MNVNVYFDCPCTSYEKWKTRRVSFVNPSSLITFYVGCIKRFVKRNVIIPVLVWVVPRQL